MTKIIVHHFKVWDAGRGDYVVPPTNGGKTSKRTSEDIDRIGGVIIPNTGEAVGSDELDAHGRYFPKGEV